MKQYTVTGMSCAACSARVEKAVSGVPGVEACSVSLLTNSMGVEGTADEKSVIAAVEAAGYGASPKGAASPTASAEEDALADKLRSGDKYLQKADAAYEDGKKATMIFDRSTRAGENYDRELIEVLHALAPAGDMLGMAVRMLEAAEREEGGEWIY